VAQLHHAGMRSPAELIGEAPHCPSDNDEFKARGLSAAEVEQLTEDFIAAAVRAERAGFDGVELHGAHGYVLCQFLSAEINQRTDRWGGSLDNRSRIVTDIIDGVRARCRPDFSLGVRLSPERFGMQLSEVRTFAGQLMARGDVDYLDLSLWDVFKEPIEAEFQGRSLMSYFTDLPRNGCRVGAAGKIMSGADVQAVLDAGCDFAVVGRAGILHHDYPKKVAADAGFRPIALPVTREHLRAEGLGPAFLDYMNGWKGFIAQEEPVA
jgi:2,4-dienoyl-CoA reductase-like NADH-dependent reductase (Old Yellow Enzyme family)